MAVSYINDRVHWNYFLALQDDFSLVARYIEPCEKNNDVFSIELARILMTATQEVDVLMKMLCGLLNPGCDVAKVGQYYDVIESSLPEVKKSVVGIGRFGMKSQPFIDWEKTSPPLWWTANNKIKHSRHIHFDYATFKNTFDAMAGLFVCVAYYYQQLRKSRGKEHSWALVSQFFDIASHTMLFDLIEPPLIRIIDGGVLLPNGKWGTELELDDMKE